MRRDKEERGMTRDKSSMTIVRPTTETLFDSEDKEAGVVGVDRVDDRVQVDAGVDDRVQVDRVVGVDRVQVDGQVLVQTEEKSIKMKKTSLMNGTIEQVMQDTYLPI